MAATDHADARRAPPARGLRGVRGAARRQAGRVPRLRVVDPEAAPGARPDAHVLRARVRERPPRGLPALGARHRGVRGRAEDGRRPAERPVGARGDLHAQRHRGDQPRRVRLGARQPRAGRRRRHHRARAPRELRPVAVHRAADRCLVPAHPDRRQRRAPARCARRALARGEHQGRREQPRLELARHHQPRRDARRVGARARGDHGRRRGAGRSAPGRRRAGARRATSSRSRPTSSAGRAASARCGGVASSSRR